jgi:hypothetical protein
MNSPVTAFPSIIHTPAAGIRNGPEKKIAISVSVSVPFAAAQDRARKYRRALPDAGVSVATPITPPGPPTPHRAIGGSGLMSVGQ